MNWFNGEIVNAIELQRRNKSVFMVAVLGQNRLSVEYEEILNRNEVSSILNSEKFVAVKLIPNSIEHHQFLKIFTFAPSPSIHFISINGTVIKLFYEHIDDNCFPSILDEILDQHERILKSDPSNKNVNESDVSHVKENDTKKCDDIVDDKDQLQIQSKDMNKKHIAINEINEKKQKIDEIKKQRMEEKLRRDLILTQIAEDRNMKAEKDTLQKTKTTDKSTKNSTPSVPIKNNSNITRIQFRFPDGTVRHHEFDSLMTLSIIYNYVIENMPMSNVNFKLATTFPKVEFTELDYSKNLIELNLTPSAVLLVLVVKKAQPSNIFWQFYSMIVKNVTYYLLYLSTFFFGDQRDSITSQNEDEVKSNKNTNEGKSVEKQGNIHRLKDGSSDNEDDENKFWNGNSTQQL